MKIAVVIPAVDEAENVAGAVASALALDVEVIVVDGGSRDETCALARESGALVLDAERGRARQLQVGVDRSEGDALLLLHADTRLPTGWEYEVRRTLRDPGVAGGAFRLRFDDRRLVMRIVEWGGRLRAAWFGLPLGDQALFVRRSVLEEIGGVPQVPVLEDLDFVIAIRAHGRLVQLPLPATTSARRYRGRVGRTVAVNLLALGAWRMGWDRNRIAGWLGR